MMQRWFDPYSAYLALAAKYLELWPQDSIKWRFGENALAQDTAEVRVVCVFSGVLESTVLGAHFMASLEPLPADEMPEVDRWDRCVLDVYVFAPPAVLFSAPDPLYIGLKDRVYTTIYSTMLGWTALELGDSRAPSEDFSHLPSQMWTWIFPLIVPVPVFRAVPSLAQPSIITEVVQGDHDLEE